MPLRRTFLLILVALAALLVAASVLNHAARRDAFMGDSLTEWWSFPRTNLGIHGQTSAQMLARFPTQVPGHHYRRVFILAGTNDTLLHVDPTTTIANLDAMVTLAQQDNVEPVLCEIPPIYYRNGQYQPAVQALNTRIIALAATRHLKLVDYYDALANHPSGYSDGIHLKRRNYLRMERALLQTANPF